MATDPFDQKMPEGGYIHLLKIDDPIYDEIFADYEDIDDDDPHGDRDVLQERDEAYSREEWELEKLDMEEDRRNSKRVGFLFDLQMFRLRFGKWESGLFRKVTFEFGWGHSWWFSILVEDPNYLWKREFFSSNETWASLNFNLEDVRVPHNEFNIFS